MILKLFVVMGVSWMLEILSTIFDGEWWFLSDLFNLLQGVLVFAIFVCNQKVFSAFREKFGMFVDFFSLISHLYSL